MEDHGKDPDYVWIDGKGWYKTVAGEDFNAEKIVPRDEVTTDPN